MTSQRFWIFRSIALAFALVAVALAQPAMAQDAAMASFKRCIDGTADEADAEAVGLTLGRRFAELRFDAGIFSDACADKILPHTFGTYDEVTSLKLVAFFWSDAFLGRLLEMSIAKPAGLSCNLSCLLSLDRRLVPTLSLFAAVMRDRPGLSLPDNLFLPARTLLTGRNIGPERISALLGSVEDASVREDVIRVLYWLADPVFIRGTFQQSADPARVCVAEGCIAVAAGIDPANCADIDGAIAAARSPAAWSALSRSSSGR